MASSSSCMGLIVVVVVAALLQCTAAATFTVGDTTGWSLSGGSQFYANWASGKTFAVGDTLIFNFNAQAHDVATVPKTAFDACTSTNTIGDIVRASPATITLNNTGSHYYICTFPGHCGAGQKLSIEVVSSSTGSPTTPTTPATPPTEAASGPSPPASSGGDNPPSAAPALAAGFGIMGFAAAIFSAFFL